MSAVITSKGERRGRDVVLALGAWSPTLGRELGLRIPIQPGKGYSITYERPAVCPRIPLTLKERSARDGVARRISARQHGVCGLTSLNRRRLDALVHGAAEYLIEPEGPRRIEE